MKELLQEVSFSKICGLFGKSRQAWYDIRSRDTDPGLQESLVLDWVREIRSALPRIGTIKLYHMLKPRLEAHRIKLGRDGLYRLLAGHQLLIQRRKKRVYTTDSNHMFRKWPNLVTGLAVTRPDQLWVSDITYLTTDKGFIYLSLVTDAYSRKIVGYHLSQHLKAVGCISALQKAIKSRRTPLLELIHHSDRGIQYCCDGYVSILQDKFINISMTQSGSPYDNALAERVNGILKQEFGLDRRFGSYKQAIEPVANAIHAYNHLRPHLSCGLKTPDSMYYLESQNALSS
ncbi:IS3 family transposase [Chitinophaga sedimenti]|uniref:IS3 family transposase n=1 Tax=Chitinophaga sedimenti TaxID=2033606 RepID=UPI0020036DDD|nr:IS3 family transposase [Chitinophaga sedimenti]MCK7554398.1 IS3 family transposase [Chitinophaga sedimenti]MCK7558564.1 IS3 family transposase [Chitinophaga sedimenti]